MNDDTLRYKFYYNAKYLCRSDPIKRGVSLSSSTGRCFDVEF